MAAGRGDFQGASRLQLAAHVGQIGTDDFVEDAARRAGRRQVLCTTQPAADIGQGIGHQHLGIGHQGGLGRIAPRHHHPSATRACTQQGGEYARHGAQGAGQGQFAEEFAVVQFVARHLAAGGEDTQRDGQVEAAAILGQFGRRQVHGDPAVGIFEGGVLDGYADTITRFAHGGFGKTHDIGAGQAAGQMDFHHDLGSRHAFLGSTEGDGKTHVARTPATTRERLPG